MSTEEPHDTPHVAGREEEDWDDLVSVAEAATLLKLKRSTLDHYRCEGRGPVYRKHGGRVFYSRKILIAWSKRHTYQSTSERIGPPK